MGCLHSSYLTSPSPFLLENGAPNDNHPADEGEGEHQLTNINPCHQGTSSVPTPGPSSPAALIRPVPQSGAGIKESLETKIRRRSKILFGDDSPSVTITPPPRTSSPPVKGAPAAPRAGTSARASALSRPTPPAAQLTSCPRCRPEDFIVHDFLAKGGMGSVYRGTRKADGLKIALKFFGYDEKCPDMDSIQLEVTALTALRGLDGVVSLIGTFPDSPNGILGKKAYKIWPKSYPVLVMPLLEGGALIDRIHTRTSVCENDLKHWFKQFAVGLGNIHSKGYIHRDLKLENIMLETMAEDSLVRIIDFGLVIKMTGEILTSHKLSGTRGYHAPETLRWKQYSPKTDIWQAGVCLYSMLSGFLPFHPDNDAQSLEAKYFPMTGPAWLGISDRAKDLVSHILVADPDKRFSISEILKHPWMTSEASQEDLGVEYVARLKHLALRQKMRGFFLQNDIGETNKLRRGHLAELLPFLKPSARTRLASYVSINPAASATSAVKVGRINSSSSLSYGGSEHGLSCSYSSSSSHGPSSPCKSSLQERAVVEFKTKLHVFQELVIESFREKLQRVNGHSHSPDPSSSKFAYTVGGSGSPSSEQQRQGQGDRDLCLGYEEFVDLLSKAGLSHLAERTVFSIFDITNSGVIDLKEFLFTMVAFQPEDPEELNSLSCSVDLEDSSDVTLLQTIRMFFHFFDLHGSGSIQLDDFKLAVSCLLSSNSNTNANGNGGHHLQPAATLSLYSYPSQDFSDLFFSSSPPSSHGSSFFNSHSHNQSQQSHASVENIEELFLAIDTDRNGKIGFAEFRDFYLALLATTSQNGAAGQLS